MMGMKILLEGDGAFRDFQTVPKLHYLNGSEHLITVAGLEHGLESGKPSVAIGVRLGDDEAVIAETSLALFLAAADALKARYGDPRE